MDVRCPVDAMFYIKAGRERCKPKLLPNGVSNEQCTIYYTKLSLNHNNNFSWLTKSFKYAEPHSWKRFGSHSHLHNQTKGKSK